MTADILHQDSRRSGYAPRMALTLYHHPFSRAAASVWALEEIGEPYELRFVDIMAGAQKAPDLVALNPMGKLPVLTDGDAVVTERRDSRSTSRTVMRQVASRRGSMIQGARPTCAGRCSHPR